MGFRSELVCLGVGRGERLHCPHTYLRTVAVTFPPSLVAEFAFLLLTKELLWTLLPAG